VRALKIKALLKLPTKKARRHAYINQGITITMALVARAEAVCVNVALHQEICA
jgi:hypothetical protein